MGLVGMGDIAYELAKLLVVRRVSCHTQHLTHCPSQDGFNCKIVVYSPTSAKTKWTSSDPNSPNTVIPHQRASSLEEMLPQIDVLSIHCPLLPETRHMISTSELQLLKPTAIIINTARGGIIDEIALATALREGQIAGAGIDVWETEPPTTEKYAELIGMRQVVALPHLGGSTDEVTKIGCMNAVDIAFDYLEGKPARNRVY